MQGRAYVALATKSAQARAKMAKAPAKSGARTGLVAGRARTVDCGRGKRAILSTRSILAMCRARGLSGSGAITTAGG